ARGRGPHDEVLVVERVEIVVRVEPVRRIEGVGGAPREDLLADGHLERPLVGGERHLLQTQVAAMLRRLGDLEVQPAGESKVVVACLADDLQRAPRAELARPFELEEPLDRKSTRLNSVTWPSRMPSSA